MILLWLMSLWLYCSVWVSHPALKKTLNPVGWVVDPYVLPDAQGTKHIFFVFRDSSTINLINITNHYRFRKPSQHAQQTQNFDPLLIYCWSSVVAAGAQ